MYSTDFLDVPSLLTAGGTVSLPGSKSISNRVLLLSALCSGTTEVNDLLDSDDTRVMLEALRQLGCGVELNGRNANITGLGGLPPQASLKLFMGNAGTAMRPLTAALAMLGGVYELSGVPRMHERPIGDLVDALRQLGCSVDYIGQQGFPPLRLGGLSGVPSLKLEQAIQVRGDVSSQFLTALLMALPLATNGAHGMVPQPIVIEVVGELISKPYIDITLQLLARYGIAVQREGWSRFTIPAGSRYQSPGRIHVEADASSASYFIALGAIASATPGHTGIRIEGVGADSIQGDIRFIEAARLMGAEVQSGPNWLHVSRDARTLATGYLQAIDLDCNHIPDAAMTLAVMALYAQGTTRLRNIASWRVKETDRIAAMAKELRKLGANVVEGADFIEVTPPEAHAWQRATIHTYDDHRVAMCFSLAAFNPAGLPVRIEDPKCVAKTFPDYFETLFEVVQTPASGIPVVCVDGPTASGKGTLAAALAQRLGYHYLDSGALYRIAGLAATRQGLALSASNEGTIAQLTARLTLRFLDDKVFMDGEDVSDAIRTEQAGMNASHVSALPQVRAALLALQQGFRQLPGLVADGRDMGTVIFPDAPLKIYLTASAAKRAERRHKQLIAKGIHTTIDTLCADLMARDERDSTRSVAPLKPAQDAVLLDNSALSVEESVAQVLTLWHDKQQF